MNIWFYWYYIVVMVVGSGSVYTTGEYRLPQSEQEFSDVSEVKWVIAGQDGLSSCYAWVREEGEPFRGFYSTDGRLLTSETDCARLWAVSHIAERENGIVSGLSYYPQAPTDTIYAVFGDIDTDLLSQPLSPSANRVLRQGQLLIDVNGIRYDALGRLLNSTSLPRQHPDYTYSF